MQLFPTKQTNSYGRSMITRFAIGHENLIGRASVVVDDRLQPSYKKFSQTLRAAERHLPPYNIVKEMEDQDIMLSNMIRDACTACDDHLDAHIMRFRELRQKHPNHEPCWAEQYEVSKMMSNHEKVIAKARKWVDDEPPAHALHYRSLMRRTPFTRGGFPRPVRPSKTTSKRKNLSERSLLPARRVFSSLGDEIGQMAGGPDWRAPPSAPSKSPTRAQTVCEARAHTVPQLEYTRHKILEEKFGKRPHWALADIDDLGFLNSQQQLS